MKSQMFYEETAINGKIRNLFRKEDKNMESKVTTKKPKQQNKQKSTLGIYTYINFKRFGLAVAIDEGIKITVLWFETHIKFEKR